MRRTVMLCGVFSLLAALAVLFMIFGRPGPSAQPVRSANDHAAGPESGPRGAPAARRPGATADADIEGVPAGPNAARDGEQFGEQLPRPKLDAKERWWIPMSPAAFAEMHAMKSAGPAKTAPSAKKPGAAADGGKTPAWLDDPEATLLRYFDADGDGALSEIERAEGEAVLAAKAAESATETDAAVAAQAERWNAWQARRRARFDADGDGVLDLDESYAAYLHDVETKAVERFFARFDTNADRTIDRADLAAFMALYAQRDAGADANDDGTVDERDVEVFEIMLAGPRVP